MRKRCRNVHTQQVFVIVCFQLLYITSQIVLFNSPWLEITCMLACTWCCLCLLNIFRYDEITLVEASWINCLCDADWKQRYGERVLCPPKQQSYSWLLWITLSDRVICFFKTDLQYCAVGSIQTSAHIQHRNMYIYWMCTNTVAILELKEQIQGFYVHSLLQSSSMIFTVAVSLRNSPAVSRAQIMLSKGLNVNIILSLYSRVITSLVVDRWISVILSANETAGKASKSVVPAYVWRDRSVNHVEGHISNVMNTANTHVCLGLVLK